MTDLSKSKQMALAESERDFLESWNEAISEIAADDRITSIFLPGLRDSGSNDQSREIEIRLPHGASRQPLLIRDSNGRQIVDWLRGDE